MIFTVVNGTHKSMQETYAPAAVINALKRLGWVIPSGEQDAHELLNVILTTLDEESSKLTRKVDNLYILLQLTSKVVVFNQLLIIISCLLYY